MELGLMIVSMSWRGRWERTFWTRERVVSRYEAMSSSECEGGVVYPLPASILLADPERLMLILCRGELVGLILMLCRGDVVGLLLDVVSISN